jgi:hypothetical protein
MPVLSETLIKAFFGRIHHLMGINLKTHDLFFDVIVVNLKKGCGLKDISRIIFMVTIGQIIMMGQQGHI